MFNCLELPNLLWNPRATAEPLFLPQKLPKFYLETLQNNEKLRELKKGFACRNLRWKRGLKYKSRRWEGKLTYWCSNKIEILANGGYWIGNGKKNRWVWSCEGEQFPQIRISIWWSNEGEQATIDPQLSLVCFRIEMNGGEKKTMGLLYIWKWDFQKWPTCPFNLKWKAKTEMRVISVGRMGMCQEWKFQQNNSSYPTSSNLTCLWNFQNTPSQWSNYETTLSKLELGRPNQINH